MIQPEKKKCISQNKYKIETPPGSGTVPTSRAGSNVLVRNKKTVETFFSFHILNVEVGLALGKATSSVWQMAKIEPGSQR